MGSACGQLSAPAGTGSSCRSRSAPHERPTNPSSACPLSTPFCAHSSLLDRVAAVHETDTSVASAPRSVGQGFFPAGSCSLRVQSYLIQEYRLFSIASDTRGIIAVGYDRRVLPVRPMQAVWPGASGVTFGSPRRKLREWSLRFARGPCDYAGRGWARCRPLRAIGSRDGNFRCTVHVLA